MIKRKKFNITLLGESAVGKTSIFNCLQNKDFREDVTGTIGLDSFIVDEFFNGKKYKFKIFDTGAERYRSMSNTTIMYSEGFMVIFSVINRESFERIGEWIDNIKNIVDISKKPIFLIGNKIEAPNRQVLNEEAVEYSKINNLKYFETSAKTGYGIKEVALIYFYPLIMAVNNSFFFFEGK